MKKISFLGILFLSIFFFSSYILAQDDIDIDVDVACPSSVKIGSSLNVTVKVCNYYGDSTVILKRGMTGLLANSPSSNSISNVRVYGPYFKSFITPLEIGPGQCIQRTVRVLNSVPQDLAGTVGMVFFQFFDQYGHEIEGSACQVPIIQ